MNQDLLTEARQLDQEDPLKEFRSKFLIPQHGDRDVHYFCGNSLGLQPKATREYVCNELDDWARLGVHGHMEKKDGWFAYHELVTEPMARVVGGLPSETVVMNTLTANLHFMMVSFYRPEGKRCKILIEKGAFPSDTYAVQSQIKFHGFNPEADLIQLEARAGESFLRTEDILEVIERQGEEIALVMMGGVQYLTGQAFDMESITKAAHQKGCVVGFDLAHGAGNIQLKLHDWGVDFAVWCTYKYLNSGPGSIAGAFVHERHHNTDLPRFHGWWGHDKVKRFEMSPHFSPIQGAEAWQLSNPPILPLAALRASLAIFDEATMDGLRQKSLKLSGYLEELLRAQPLSYINILTPQDPSQRGCQLSLQVTSKAQELVESLTEQGVVCDFRRPDVIRVAPVPLYNSFEDIAKFVAILRSHTH